MGRLSKLFIGKDDKDIVTGEIPWPSAKQSQQIVLNTGIEQTLAVPAWAFRTLMIVAPGHTISCGYGDTPLTLAGNSWKNQPSEINPILRPAFDPNGNRIQTLRFISYTDDAVLNVIFYRRNEYEK